MKYLTFLFFILLFLSPLFSQQKSATTTPSFDRNKDAVMGGENSHTYTTHFDEITTLALDKEKLSTYETDKEFAAYLKSVPKKIEAPKEKSAFQKSMEAFFLRLRNWLASLQWGRMGNWFIFLIALGAASILIWGVYKVNVRNVLFKSPTPLDVELHPLETDINTTNFDALIQDALAQQNYKLAVRLLYGQSLKTLSEGGWIVWKPNKTNREYIYECYRAPFHASFQELTRRFEYIFYGEFPLDANSYKETAASFKRFSHTIAKKA